MDLSPVSFFIALLLWAIYKVISYKSELSKYKSVPKHHVVFNPNSYIGNSFPPHLVPLHKGGTHPFVSKRKDFEQSGWNVIAVMGPFPRSSGIIFIADAGVIKEITSQRTRFPKPIEQYAVLKLYGLNVVVTEADEWKKHRKISQPAFSEKNNRLVWNASASIMAELFDEVWGSSDEVTVKQTLDITIRIALMVLSIAGFGKDVSWKTDADIPAGHRMDFTQALYVVSSNIILKVVIPTWAMGATEKLRNVGTAFDELGIYMDEMIIDRKKEGHEQLAGRWDLLTNLIAASNEEGEEETGSQLSLSELRGNIFVYLIAGHETTAHTLAYTYGLLALHPSEQDKLYQHIKSIIGEREPTYDDFPSLTYVLATFYETLRMFPPVGTIPKKTAEDTVFSVTAADSKSDATLEMFIPANSQLVLHTPGLHYNARYWPDPYSFKPERFMRDYNKDAFLPFSGGARSCIGRKFAEVEAVSVLTALISQYTIHLTPRHENEYANLPMHEQIDRLLKSDAKITLTPVDLPLVFKRR